MERDGSLVLVAELPESLPQRLGIRDVADCEFGPPGILELVGAQPGPLDRHTGLGFTGRRTLPPGKSTNSAP